MNIIICDDDIIFCQEFKKQIQQICENLTIKENIECFNDGISLKKYLEEYAIDILFLDIELDNLLGYEIGNYVRNILNLQKLEIVYVSHKPQYALSLFDTRPLNFLVKPVKNNSLEKVFQDFYKIHKNQKKVFEYKKGKKGSPNRYKICTVNFESTKSSIKSSISGSEKRSRNSSRYRRHNR